MSERNRYVYALIGAPQATPSDVEAGSVVPRTSQDPESHLKSAEERAYGHLRGLEKDLATMRQFFGRGQDVEELFSYNHVDAQGKEWLLDQLQQAFGRTDVHAFFLYYSGHGCAGDGAWYLGNETSLAPVELFQLWEESPSGRSGESVLIIISDSCFSGQWVASAERARLTTVAVQSAATDDEDKAHHDPNTGGLFTYKVYNQGRHAFQSVFSITGFFTAFVYALWVGGKEIFGFFQERKEFTPQVYVPEKFGQIMSRGGGTIQPRKVINNGRFLFVDSWEWIMFR